MRFRGLHHVEFSVLEYEKSIEFYDRMFGWLGYSSLCTLDIGYRSTYYAPNFYFVHSYIGIQPARTGDKLDPEAKATGIHHAAVWATSRRQVDKFYTEFLKKNDIKVTEAPQEYFYTPGYYAVFFDDPINGIHWEVASMPLIPSPWALIKWNREFKKEAKKVHPYLKRPFNQAIRKLPGH